MKTPLPKAGKAPVKLPHFPAVHQAFIFRASEFVSFEKIASVLGTGVDNVRECARQMGIERACGDGDLWLKKGYISVIRAMWHILPYSQLLELIGVDGDTLAAMLREEDFLDVKLGPKPVCEEVRFRELTPEEAERTRAIREVVESLDESGAKAFDFRYLQPEIKFGGREVFETRIIYPFSGLYLNAFETDSETWCPDGLLESYRRLGVNGVFTQGILHRLTPFPFDPSVSGGWERRLENLKKYTERLKKFGIKLYLYLNEPRPMTDGFFETREDLRGMSGGRDNTSLCTSVPAVREYLRSAVKTVCRAAPDIGGFITITRSENQTNCYSHAGKGTCQCERCSKRTVGEVVAEVISCLREGADHVDKNIKVFAWSWGWDEYTAEIIDRLPPRVILLSQSEKGVEFETGGVKNRVVDYSMSRIGPGAAASSEWSMANKRGLETAAKVQINTTWEGSTVPAIPVLPLVEDHIKALRDAGVRHLMLSWTLGGYPSYNIAAAARYFYTETELPELPENVRRAQEVFSEAFKEFPFDLLTLYMGPQNGGPANLLFPEPTGYKATMTCFAYDDLESWRSVYSEDVFESQLEKLCRGWEKGLEYLEGDKSETAAMAKAALCLYRSSLSQVRFIRARNAGDKEKMREIARDEEATARLMLSLMNENPAIGFEAANHYYFTKRALVEKVVNAAYIAAQSPQ